MVNQWVTFVKQYQEDHNLSYRDALAKAGGPYREKYGVKTPRTGRQKGKGLDDAIEAVADASTGNDELLELADKGLSFTKGVLEDDTRIRRVEKRQDRRNTRATRRQNRRQESKDIKQDRKNEKQQLKTDKTRQKREVREAKHKRKLSKI
eukprot:Lithocolla_globosa_v1_NODE_1804_length_2322_cov_72.594177.p2 type:complete len:150 gc:universal NODE_1804_length_2322_cov_72.594177:1317-868(-)